jgi:hypothetical protein
MVITQHVFPLPAGVIGSAKFCTHQPTPCHRYALYRERTHPRDLFSTPEGQAHVCRTLAAIAMNPSAAAGDRDDQMVKVVWNLAEYEGFCRLAVLNAYGYCSTDPKSMRRAADPIGERNDARILTEVVFADRILACWGGIDPARDAQLRELLRPVSQKVFCLGLTKNGQPRYPARIRTKGVQWQPLPIVRIFATKTRSPVVRPRPSASAAASHPAAEPSASGPSNT